MSWNEYRQQIRRMKEAFPGCAFYEISSFVYSWGRKNPPIRDRYFQVSTNAWGEGEIDCWEDFEQNNWVFTGGDYPILRDIQPGDVMLVRTGRQQGRGIGVVYRNDHQDDSFFTLSEGKIHVLWMNKEPGVLARMTPREALTRAQTVTMQAFRLSPTYAVTFELLGRLRGGELSATNPEDHLTPDPQHSLNQILYGPPGTGKTYHTVDHALAIIDPGSVSESRENKVKGTSKNASWMVKDDRIGHSHRFGGKINSAFRGISPLGNGDSAVKEDIWYAPSHTAYAQPTIPRRCNPTKRRML